MCQHTQITNIKSAALSRRGLGTTLSVESIKSSPSFLRELSIAVDRFYEGLSSKLFTTERDFVKGPNFSHIR